jgi:hypothetical protein
MDDETLLGNFEDDPALFIELFLGRDLSKKQKIFIDRTKDKKHIVAIWSRQSGKSTVMAAYIVWRLLYGKGAEINKEWMSEHIAIVAPIKEQLTNLYEKIRTLVDRNEFIKSFIIKMNSARIMMKNGNQANFMSASPGSHIRGYTATCIVIDESQDISDHKYTADILPFGATTNALIIEAGTPKTKNHFFQVINSPEIEVVRQPWFECPFLSEEYVLGQKAISPELLWRQEYLCEFVEEGVLAFPSWLFEPEAKEGIFTGRWNLGEYDFIQKREHLDCKVPIDREAAYAAGLDLGKTKDNTVYVIYRTDLRPIKLVVKIKFDLKTSYMDVAKTIAIFHKYYQPYEFNVDYTNEKSFIEILQENDVPVVVDKKMKRGAISFGMKNKREMINNTRMLLEQFALQIPKDAEDLIAEFTNQQYEVDSMDNYKYFHPSNTNDDSLWATLLALKNVRILTLGDVTSFVNPWLKQDTKVQGREPDSKREVLCATQKYRRTSQYIASDIKRMRYR